MCALLLISRRTTWGTFESKKLRDVVHQQQPHLCETVGASSQSLVEEDGEEWNNVSQLMDASVTPLLLLPFMSLII